ncbi:Zn(2)-C6 fungal-type domain-containing protein [Favolaschia claudopus]|uniref:Zn(2)-C6 fungal-type domain-containing protein n=1 Tax=Favolaschia claudopus TaxID=2862362 RepID=A0AAW0AB00_9AGAR
MSSDPNVNSAPKPVRAPRKRPPKPRTEPLRRGKACLNCRHLKIRCDGARPVCGPCTRVPKDDECEYTDGHSRTKELQATINRLNARVKELEDPNYNKFASVTLTRPNSTDPGPCGSPFNWSSTSPPSPASSIVSGGSSFVSTPDSDHSLLGVQEPPFPMVVTLLDAFLPHASQFGFFMHPGRFRASALLQLPLGHPARPSPAVLCTAYLWGIHLSRSEPLVSYEAVFIRRAQQHIATELSESAHSVHRLHTIQAHVLLASYFLRTKQFIEAEFHTNGSVTLALGYHLHKIRSTRPPSPPLIGASTFTEVFPDPPRDDVEEGERIRGFWTVVSQQNNLLMTVRTANNLGVLDSPNVIIDTPWPLDMEEYEVGMLSRDFRNSDTVRNFVNGGVPGPSSIFSLKIQASVLLQQAIQLARRWSPVMQPQASAALLNATAWLDARIQQFHSELPLLVEYYNNSEEARTLAVTHALIGAASIQLHKNDSNRSATCINAARSIVVALGDTNIPDSLCAGPAAGTLLLLACQIAMREIEQTRYFRASVGSTLNVEVSNQEEAGLLLDLQHALTTMAIHAVDSPLVQFQLSKIQQKCDQLGL